jgi:hypothetical protein
MSSSKLDGEAAYWAYWQYYIPKVGFPLPAHTLSKKNCEQIQLPVIFATLSKLHFNCNTTRAIVFAPTKFAVINLPHPQPIALGK